MMTKWQALELAIDTLKDRLDVTDCDVEAAEYCDAILVLERLLEVLV
jgi:hypothetical protein